MAYAGADACLPNAGREQHDGLPESGADSGRQGSRLETPPADGSEAEVS